MVASLEKGNIGPFNCGFCACLQNFVGAGTLIESIWESLRELGNWPQRVLQWASIILVSNCMFADSLTQWSSSFYSP